MFLNALGCLSGGGQLPSQGPVQVHMVVHADPLIRGAGATCENPDLERCGFLQGSAFLRRTNNLVWLAQDWMKGERTVDVQVGPDVAMAWAGDPDVLADIGQEVGEGTALETAELGRTQLANLIGRGSATMGLHGHGQVRDESGMWGDVPAPTGTDPCLNTNEDELAEWVLVNQVEGAAALAEELGVDLLSISSHVPRTMSGKIMAANDPDGLDPDQSHSFSSRFRPISVGGGLSACLSGVLDHPPFEAYGASPNGPVLAGDGPMVVPSVRVVGSMAPHYGMTRDGSLPAAHRRLIQLLVNWRFAALNGEPERAWAFGFHAHLFDLQDGKPNPWDPADRELDPAVGQSFRGEVEALSQIFDGLAEQAEWNGVVSTSGQVAEWRTVEKLSREGSQFSFGTEGEPLPSDPEASPYLPLVSNHLARSHYACDVQIDSAHVYGFERCASGWSWGHPGYGCADKQDPVWVGLIVPDLDGCISILPKGLRVAPVNGGHFSDPDVCLDGIWVPKEGMLVEVSRDAALPERCASG